jgi:hypothetical protein
LRNKDVYNTLEEEKLGAYIGAINISAPTCADDICCLTNSPIDLQACLYIVEDFVKRERMKINNSKSDILRYNTPDVEIQWELCDTNIDETQSTTHLGIIRNNSGKLDLDKTLKTGRQTLYSLFGAGLHGRNDLNPQISKHMWSQDSFMAWKYNI